MKKVLILSSFLCLLYTQAKADWLDRFMSQKTCNLFFSDKRAEALPLKIQNGLLVILRTYLSEGLDRSKVLDGDSVAVTPRVISTINFKEDLYKVHEVLGSGSEGIVYVAEGPKGLVLIKEFDSKSAEGEVSDGTYADLKVLDTDKKLIMLELVIGPITEILKSENEIEGHGVSYELAWDIYNYFRDKVGEEGDFNHIIDIKTGNLVLIDPQ